MSHGRLLLRFDNSATWLFPRTVLLSISKPAIAKPASEVLLDTLPPGAVVGRQPSGSRVAPMESRWEVDLNMHITVTPMVSWHDLGRMDVTIRPPTQACH